MKISYSLIAILLPALSMPAISAQAAPDKVLIGTQNVYNSTAYQGTEMGVVTYDAQGRLKCIQFQSPYGQSRCERTRYDFSYEKGTYKLEGSSQSSASSFTGPFDYDAKITVYSSVGYELGINTYLNEESTIYAQLGENGFARKILKDYRHSGYQSMLELKYDAEGHLIYFKETLDGNYTGSVIYKDGDIVEVKYVNDSDVVDPALVGKHQRRSKSRAEEEWDDSDYFTYGENPIENKGGLMMYDECFGMELGESGYFYFAGLMGTPSAHLPIQSTWSDEPGEYMNSNWVIGDDGYPVSLTKVESGYEDEPYTLKFNWASLEAINPRVGFAKTADAENPVEISWNPVPDAIEYHLIVSGKLTYDDTYVDSVYENVWTLDKDGKPIEDEDEPGSSISGGGTRSADGRISLLLGDLYADTDSDYTYLLTAFGASDTVIGSWTGTFTADLADVTEIKADNQAKARIFTIQGVEVNNMEATGIYIIKEGEKVTKIVK